jgi:type I restriction enzyme S subunit
VNRDRRGWTRTKLGDITTLIRNGHFARRPNDEGKGTPILRISAVRGGRVDIAESRFVEGVGPEQIATFSINAGDVLLTRYNGSRHLVGIPGIVPDHCRPLLYPDKLIRVVVDPALADSRFVNYQLQAPEARNFLGPRIRTTAGQSGISGRDVREIPLVLPPLDEQRRLVEILDDHLSRLDAADTYFRAATRRAERMLTSLIWKATHDLPGAERVRLDAIAEVRLGRQRSPRNHTGDRMRPYLRAANVDWDTLRLDDMKEMNFTESEEATYRLDKDDILLTEASGSPAEVGKSVLYRGSPAGVCFQNTLLRVRCHGANPEFVQKYLLAEALTGRFMPKSRGVGINHLGRARLAALEVDLPSASAQVLAVERVAESVAELGRLRSTILRQQRRAESLRRSLLAAAFSGSLSGTAMADV